MGGIIGKVLISRLQLLGELSEEDRQVLLTIQGETREIPRGQDILRTGDRPAHAVVVIEGWLQRYTIGAEGRRQVHSFFLPSDTPSLESLPIDIMDNNLASVGPSRIGLIPHAELERVSAARPHVLKLIWRETLVQGAVVREWLMRNSQLPAHASMAHFFCEIMVRARAAGIANGDGCDFPMTQQDISDALGMSPVHVNRTLMVLRGSGVELRNRTLTITDLDQLMEIGDFDPGYLHLRPQAAPATNSSAA